jgi:RND family efflux transporter MFP subunit
VTRRDLVRSLVVRGGVVALPNEDVRIAALVPGRVVSVTVAEGDPVKRGQAVARIDRRPFEDQQRQARAALAQAKAVLENARLNLDRNERLFERGIAAGKEVEDAATGRKAAEAGVEQATAALDATNLQLSRTSVTSPIAGHVVKRLVSVGEQVDGTAAQPIVEVANVDRVEMAAAVPADSLGSVRAGQAAVITSDAYPDRTFPGEVITIAPSVDVATNTALARIRIPNSQHLLKVGMFVQAALVLQQKRGVLTVPASALSRSEQGAAVYVVSGDTASRTAVVTGLENADAVEIVSGLKEGGRVLISAVHGLGDRARLAQPK